MSISSSEEYHETLIGEPVTNPFGEEVGLFKSPTGVVLKVGCISSFYDDKEVEHLGNGNWGSGLMKLATDGNNTGSGIVGTPRSFQNELKDLRPELDV